LLFAILQPVNSLANPSSRDVTWEELSPGGLDPREYVRNASPLAALILSPGGEAHAAAKLAYKLNGVRIRLSGYVVPLKVSGNGVGEFLLVPYVGACIHVPPPPRNQIVLVTSAKPFKSRGMFQAVTVTGTMSVNGSEAKGAATGYRIMSGEIADYDEYRQIKKLLKHPE
jgi:hypothetical protein